MWKTIDGESANRESDDVMTVCYQQESEQDKADRIKKEADSTGKVMNIKKHTGKRFTGHDSLK